MRKYFKTYLLLGVILLLGGRLYAQQDDINGFYMYNPLKYNPAIVGTDDRVVASAVYRNQWTSLEGAPDNYSAYVSSPLARLIKYQENSYTLKYPAGLSLGLMLTQDNIGISKLSKIGMPLGVRIRIDKSGSRLSFGIKPVLNILSSNYNDLVQDGNDPLNGSYTDTFVDFELGWYFYNQRWYIGASVTNLREIATIEDFGYHQDQHYFISGGYIASIADNVLLRTTSLVSLVSNSPASVTVSPTLIFNKRLYAGAAYRHKDMLGLNTAYNLSDNLKVGYSYEYPIAEKANNVGSTHEIMVKFSFNKLRDHVVSPRFFW